VSFDGRWALLKVSTKYKHRESADMNPCLEKHCNRRYQSLSRKTFHYLDAADAVIGIITDLGMKVLYMITWYRFLRKLTINISHKSACLQQRKWINNCMKNAVFWDDTPCGSCKNRRFRITLRLHHQGSGAKFFGNIGSYKSHAA
jgi:hypothetical protein